MTAPTFALLLGLLYVALGALAMLSSLVLPAPESPDRFGFLFGVFGASPLLNGVHLLIGLWGFVAWSGALSAVSYARAMAAVLGLLTLTGMAALVRPEIMPLGGHNIWLHGFSALAAAWIGWRSLVRRPGTTRAERRHGALNRRVAIHPVARDRRAGNFDRRLAGG